MSYKDTIKRKKLTTQIVTVVKAVTGTLDEFPEGQIPGVDVDFYAGPFDFDVLRNAGGKVAFVRAGQNLWVDPLFHNNWINSKLKVKRGAYWFLDKNVSMDGQARIFASLFGGLYDGELPIVLDCEQDTWIKQKKGKPIHLDASDALSFLIDFKHYLPSWNGEAIIYTGLSWWETHGSTDPQFRNFGLWLSSPDTLNPPVLHPWDTWDVLQTSFSGNGPKYGTVAIPGHPASKGIDLDIVSQAFAQRYGIS
jgi:GH25 family lysozyme M1 (1,4-beta-N-acetylmuramidase)